MARLDKRFIIDIMRQIWLFCFILIFMCLTSCDIAGKETPIIPGSMLITRIPADPTQPTTKTLKPNKTPLPTLTSTVVLSLTEKHELDTSTPEPIIKLCSPLAEQTLQEIQDIVTDPYDPPSAGSDARHHGTDIAYYRRKDRKSIEGEIVQSILSGHVIAVVVDQLPYGNMLIIESTSSDLPPEIIDQLRIAQDESLYTLYAHLANPPFFSIGDQVKCGQDLGNVGATGYNIVNPHLHLETRVGPAGNDFEAGMAYYDTRSSKIERSNYELWRTSGIFRHFDPIAIMNIFIHEQGGDEFLR